MQSHCLHKLTSQTKNVQLDKKREDFRKYLEGAGAIDNLTKALIKLYEQPNKPSDAVKFLRKNMCESCPDEEQYEAVVADLEHANKKICALERELSQMKGSVKRTASEIDLTLTTGFEELGLAENAGVLQKALTKDVMESLKTLRTQFKGTLLDCIQSGLEILDSPVGAFACDAEAYTLFANLFDKLVESLQEFKSEDKHPDSDWGESCKLSNLDPEDEFIVSTRVQCSRSVADYPFAAIMTIEHYEEIMGKAQKTAKCMTGDLKGKFHALEGMDDDLKKVLRDKGVMLKENDALLTAAKATRFWPVGRGLFINEAETFVVRVNEEDHLRFISTEAGGNLRKKNFSASKNLNKKLERLKLFRLHRLGL